MGHITRIVDVAIVYEPFWSRERPWIAVNARNPAEMIVEDRWASPFDAYNWVMSNSPTTEAWLVWPNFYEWNLRTSDYVPLGSDTPKPPGYTYVQ